MNKKSESATPMGFDSANANFVFELGLYPVTVSIPKRTNHKLSKDLWPEILEKSQVKTYRELADEYGISHEAVRRVCNRALSIQLVMVRLKY